MSARKSKRRSHKVVGHKPKPSVRPVHSSRMTPEGSDQRESSEEELDNLKTQPGPIYATPVPPCRNECRGKAFVFCKDCMAFYCKPCSASHQRVGDLTSHLLKPLKKVPPNVCVEHEENFRSVCNTCTSGTSVRLICGTCVNGEHEDHEVVDMSDSAQVAREEYRRLLLDAQSDLATKKTFSEKLADTLEEVDMYETIAKNEIKETFTNLSIMIAVHRKQLEMCTTRHFNTVRSNIKGLKTITDINRERCESSKLEMERLLKSDSPLDQIRQMPLLKENVDKVTNERQPNVGFRLVRRNKQTTLDLEQHLQGQIELTEPLLTLERDFRLKYSGQKVVSGMVVVGDCLCVTHVQDPNLWIYDISGSRSSLRASEVPHLQDPRGMGLLSLDERALVISDQHVEGGRLHFIKLKPSLDIDYIRCVITHTKQPRKVTVCRDTGEVLIGQLDNSEFLLFNVQGALLKRISMSSGKSPVCVTKVSREFAVLTCDERRTCMVECLDRYGKPQKKYQAATRELFKGAHHMVPDDKERIIIADFANDRLVLLEASGKGKVILNANDQIFGPQCLFLDNTASRLYLVHGKPGAMEVRVYQWFGNREAGNFQVALTLPCK